MEIEYFGGKLWSSTAKYELLSMNDNTDIVITKGLVEIGNLGSPWNINQPSSVLFQREEVPINVLHWNGLSSDDRSRNCSYQRPIEIDAVGHRVVHGEKSLLLQFLLIMKF